MIAGAAAVALTGAVGVWLAVEADEEILVRANGTAVAIAAAVLAGGLAVRLALAVPVAVVLLGTEYVALLGLERETLDQRAPLVAAALFAVAELSYWSLELRGAVADEAGTYLRRLALLAAMAAGTIALGAVLLAVAAAARTGGIPVDMLGTVAAVGALALLALAARARI